MRRQSVMLCAGGQSGNGDICGPVPVHWQRDHVSLAQGNQEEAWMPLVGLAVSSVAQSLRGMARCSLSYLASQQKETRPCSSG